MQKSGLLRKFVPFMMSFALLFGSAASVMAEYDTPSADGEDTVAVESIPEEAIDEGIFLTDMASEELEPAIDETEPDEFENPLIDAPEEINPEIVVTENPQETIPEIIVDSKHSVYLKNTYDHVSVSVSAVKEELSASGNYTEDTTPYDAILNNEDLIVVTVEQESDQLIDSEDLVSIMQDFEEETEETGFFKSDTSFWYEEGTTVYISAIPENGYQIRELQVTEEDGSPVAVGFDLDTGLYSFALLQKDVSVEVIAEEEPVDSNCNLEESEIQALEEYVEEQGFEVSRAAMLQAAAASQVRTVTFNMNGFISYSAEGYGSGYDAMFYINRANYKGNGNGYCLNPAVQAPGHDKQGQSISYTTTVTDYTDPMLLKIMYYGFGGPGDITASHASTPTARHILTHMVCVKRAAELGIPGAGSYTYGANSTAIAKADALYNAIKAKSAINGTVGVLTPVAGQQTLMLLSDYSVPETTGKLKLKKTSADASMTTDNPCYSLEGAEYNVYSDSALTKKVGTFTTNATGSSTTTLTLNPGTYYVKESKAPKGYALDTTVYRATVTAGSTSTVNTSDTPLNDPVTVLLQKVDAVTGEATTRLKGAQFTVKYYPVEEEADMQDPKYTWVFETNENGIVRLADSYKVSGDDLVTGSTGAPILPLGIITIQETKAPFGYLINDTLYICRTEVINGVVRTTNLPTGEMAVQEQPAVTDLSIHKTVTGSGGNKNDVFNFTLTLTNKADPSVIPEGFFYFIEEEGKEEIQKSVIRKNGVYSFTLQHGQTAVFKDVPIGVTYSVTETDGSSKGYTVTYTNAKGITASGMATVQVVNNKEMTIPTGADTNRNIMFAMMSIAALMVLMFSIVRVRFDKKN